jgi:hypothetical protein
MRVANPGQPKVKAGRLIGACPARWVAGEQPARRIMATKCDIVMIVIPGDLDYRYDRRVDPDFLDLFDARGAFRTLTEYACKARYPEGYSGRPVKMQADDC